MHAPGSILEQGRKFGPDVTEMRAIKHTMELIAHSLCIDSRVRACVSQLVIDSKVCQCKMIPFKTLVSCV